MFYMQTSVLKAQKYLYFFYEKRASIFIKIEALLNVRLTFKS